MGEGLHETPTVCRSLCDHGNDLSDKGSDEVMRPTVLSDCALPVQCVLQEVKLIGRYRKNANWSFSHFC